MRMPAKHVQAGGCTDAMAGRLQNCRLLLAGSSRANVCAASDPGASSCVWAWDVLEIQSYGPILANGKRNSMLLLANWANLNPLVCAGACCNARINSALDPTMISFV